jgi:ABC-type nickel/cobalt efflux system permease component RcnA
MGNFSINHYAGLTIQPDTLELRYLIDMAEIPTFQEMQQFGIEAQNDDPRVKTYLARRASDFANSLLLTIDGYPSSFDLVSQEVIFAVGAGNLPTMKFSFLYRSRLPDQCRGNCELSYQDTNFPGRSGWKEIVTSVGPGIHLTGDAKLSKDRSGLLTDYPNGMLNSPPQDLTARLTLSTGTAGLPPSAASAPKHTGPRPVSSGQILMPAKPSALPERPAVSRRMDLQPNRPTTPRNAFTELMAPNHLSAGFVIIAAFIAAGLGALHALEPGHGKTIVAAYLVGSRGTARHAFLLGLIVTISHTAGVYLLGAVTLFAQKYVLPDRLYPFLSVLSGMLIAGMGFYLFLQRLAGDFAHTHTHGPGTHRHGLWWHSHAPSGEPEALAAEPPEDSREPEKRIRGRQLAILGITGGMVPCPAAIVVLLSAAAFHRVVFGLFLIAAFSAGLAATLIALGVVVVSVGRLVSRRTTEGPLVRRWLPIGSAAVITILGCAVSLQSLLAAGIVQIRI